MIQKKEVTKQWRKNCN